jgi:hypothetical protein
VTFVVAESVDWECVARHEIPYFRGHLFNYSVYFDVCVAQANSIQPVGTNSGDCAYSLDRPEWQFRRVRVFDAVQPFLGHLGDEPAVYYNSCTSIMPDVDT